MLITEGLEGRLSTWLGSVQLIAFHERPTCDRRGRRRAEGGSFEMRILL
jgi:hypothetical protein